MAFSAFLNLVPASTTIRFLSASIAETSLRGRNWSKRQYNAFVNESDLILFSVRRKNARTLAPGRRQVNFIKSQKREHSRKPDEAYPLIESCSPGPYLEIFARGGRPGWTTWGNQADEYEISWPTYSNHSQGECPLLLATPADQLF
jgi:N6-adenosine-specific RNA methylase IME4